MRLGDILVTEDMLSRAEVEFAHRVQRSARYTRRLGEILVDFGFCTPEIVQTCLRRQGRTERAPARAAS